MTHDVFISYSSKDKTTADAVCARLEERRLRCWIAPRDIPPGRNFAESIIDAIDTCKVFVLIWTANTNTSEHILNEINQAFDQGITIIPFRIEDVQPTKAMRYYFGRTHWLDALTPPLERHIGTLAETIRAVLDSTRDNTRETTPEASPKEPVRSEPVQETEAETRPPAAVEEKPLPASTAGVPAAEVEKTAPASAAGVPAEEEIKTVLAPDAKVKRVTTTEEPRTVPSPAEITKEKPSREAREKEVPKIEPELPRSAKVETAVVREVAPQGKSAEKVEKSISHVGLTANRKVLIPAVVGALLVAAVVLMWLLGAFKGTPSAEKAEATTPAITTTANLPVGTSTSTPTLGTDMPTPYPSWVNDFSAPILAAIQEYVPVFEDDFASLKPDWELEDHRDNPDCPNTFSLIRNGRLRLQADGNTGDGCWTWANLPNLELRNFAVQVEVNLKESGSQGQLVFYSKDKSDDSGSFETKLNYSGGDWSFDFCPGGPCINATGSATFDPGSPVTMTVIAYGNDIAVYLNGIPLHHLDHAGRTLELPGHFSLSAQSYDKYWNFVEYDNLKIWDLDSIGSYQDGVFTPHPSLVKEFSAPIMAAIQEYDPIFEDDFASLEPDWELEDRGDNPDCPNTFSEISNGSLRMQANSNLGDGCWAWANLQGQDLRNFVAQVDINVQTKYSHGTIIVEFTEEVSWAVDVSNDGEISIAFCQNNYCTSRTKSVSFDPARPVTLTLFSYGNEIACYINGIPLVLLGLQNLDSSIPRQFRITTQSRGSFMNTVEYDNLKIWDLDKIENLSTLLK